MFAYCNNNPTSACDSTGTFSQYCFAKDDSRGSLPYIYNQEAEPFASMQLGDYNVGYAGCGAVAAYNALLSMGDYESFDDVLAYFNGAYNRTFANGKFGILPWQVGAFFESRGYSVVYTYDNKSIDHNSYFADASIMFFMFPRHGTVAGITRTWSGAHFVEYSRVGEEFRGRNINRMTAMTEFDSPYEFGHRGSRFYVIGIHIYPGELAYD